MNKFGLYIIDKTLDNGQAIGVNSDGKYYKNFVWPRTGLCFNGKAVSTTNVENEAGSKFGVYMNNGNLLCNGDSLVNGESPNAKISFNSDTPKLGNVILSSNTKCVRITKNNYNKLRAGKTVQGYAPYSEDVVYYLTDVQNSVNGDILCDATLVEGHKDIIYNSFIDIENGGVKNLNTSTAAASLVGVKNYTDPTHVPEIAMRYFDVFINETSDGAILQLEYYVDDYKYSSNCPECVDSTNDVYTGVGDIFTTIIENEFGEEIFRRTTFAGQFKISVPLLRKNGTHITGKTWFNIRTIDNSGRESVTLSYRIVVTPIPKPTDKGMYYMKEEDLTKYGITTFHYKHNNIEENINYYPDDPNDTFDMRREYFKAYKNKLALGKIMKDKKAEGYSGIVLYNNNDKENKSLNDSENTVYCIDVHQLREIDTAPAGSVNANGIAPGYELTMDNYHLANPADYPNSAFSTITDYYLAHAKVTSGDGTPTQYNFYNPYNGAMIIPSVYKTVKEERKDENGNTYYEDVTYGYYTKEAFEGCKITPNTVFKNNGKTYRLSSGETPYEWVRRDGAHIKRNANDKVRVVWNYDLRPEEYFEKGGLIKPETKLLRLKNFNSFLDTPYTKNKSFVSDCERDGYVYFGYRNYSIANPHTQYLCIPDDFTLDGNYCTIVPTYADDIEKGRIATVSVPTKTNTHVKNLKVLGVYGDELVKDAYLNHTLLSYTNTMWEGCPAVTLGGARLCSFENVWVENSGGYELSMGPANKFTKTSGYSASKTNDVEYSSFSPTYIDYRGAIHSNVGPLLDDNNNALIATDSRDYVSGNARYTAPITSDFVSISDIMLNVNIFTGDSTYYRKDDGIAIFNIAGYSYETTRTSKHSTFFIHFYTSNNAYIKSVRTTERARVMPPKNSAKIRITTYATFDENMKAVPKDGDYLTGSDNRMLFNHWKARVTPWPVTSDCLIKDCKVNIGKASLLCGPAVNTSIVDTEFIGASATQWEFNYNNAVYNNEDQKGAASDFHFIRCTCKERHDHKFTTYTRLVEGMNDRTSLVDCKDFTLVGNMTRYYIDNCKFNTSELNVTKQYFNSALGIVKNCTSNMSGVDSNYGFSNVNNDGLMNVRKSNGDLIEKQDRNVCCSPITFRVSINNCLFRFHRNEYPIFGRANAFNKTVTINNKDTEVISIETSNTIQL